MSGHRYISNTTNLFEDDDAVDDDTFVNSYRGRQPAPRQPAAPAYRSQLNDFDRQRQAMLERQREIEQRTLDSSSRSIGLLRESEDIGIATAEELAAQREKLENTNKRLDEINTNLNVSQKHLNGIKSVFYGLKNYISGRSDSTPLPRSNASPNQGPSGSRPESKLEGMGPSQSQYDRYNSHPSTRIRGHDEGSAAVASGTITESQRVNQMLDNNLDEMVQAISRLKDLGSGLASEIDQHNELIDTIHDKVEGADIKIGRQNKQMNKLLG